MIYEVGFMYVANYLPISTISQQFPTGLMGDTVEIPLGLLSRGIGHNITIYTALVDSEIRTHGFEPCSD